MKPEVRAALLPALQEVEVERVRALKKTWKIILVAALLALLLFLSLFVFPSKLQFGCILITPLFTAALALMAKESFVANFKRHILAKLIQAYHPSFEYKPKLGLSQSVFTKTGLFVDPINEYQCEDLVRGVVGKTSIRFSEVRAQYVARGSKNTSRRTIFKGLLFIAEFNKPFSGATYVFPDKIERTLGRFGQTLQSWKETHGQLVVLEDAEFERAFAVYGSDQIEARYILSPALMRRILNYYHKTGLQLHLAFRNAEVAVAMPLERNLFEPRLTKSMLDDGVLNEFWSELDLLTGLVEELNLNNRIWTKR